MNLLSTVTNSIKRIWLWEPRYLAPALSPDFACHHLTDGLEAGSWASDAELPIQLELDLGSP